MTPVHVAVAVIRHRGRIFVQRRDLAAPRAPGLWEFPGGKLEPAEPAEAALFRELLEEVRWTPSRAAALEPLAYAYTHGTVVLHPFLCEVPPARPPVLTTPLAWGWFTREELGRLPMPAANGGLLRGIP